MTHPGSEKGAAIDSSHSTQHGSGSRFVMIAIGVVLVFYAIATASGWTDLLKHDSHPDHEDSQHVESASHGAMPSPLAIAPFVLLLGAIAVLPLISATEHWWESNLHRFYVAAGLAVVTLLYYLLVGGGLEKVATVLEHAILAEYIPFIVLLFALYTISGGIRIEGDLAAHPATNMGFIAVGGLLASFIGTTGAAMLLIRPLLETNRERHYVQHTVVFFIFVVCNCGGCLLPIGDPPLFLGYLQGVEFLWTMWHLWLPWLAVNTVLIAVYYVWDKIVYRWEEKKDIRRDERQIRPMRIAGLWPNALLLVGIIFSVALLDPKKPVPGTEWHPWLFLREAVQLGLVGASLLLGSEKVRNANRFNYHAIVEVAALFIGIFICMQPAIEILNIEGPSLGLTEPWQLFWATGSLSAVLDNAPTYLVFFKTAAASYPGQNFAELVSTETTPARLLVGISLGAVFMGAMTYIGNGPNFMVKAIAEQSGVRMPSFFGYVVRYSMPILIPIFALATVVYLL